MTKTPHGEEPPCPITGRPYFMHIEHPDLGDVATYGGPFDSYTTPAVDDSDGERELRCERYDHDRGEWIEGGEPSGLYLVTELDWQKIHDYTSLEADNAAKAAQLANAREFVRLRWRHLSDCPEVGSHANAVDLAKCNCGLKTALADLCSDCPPDKYPTDTTRCAECPRRTAK